MTWFISLSLFMICKISWKLEYIVGSPPIRPIRSRGFVFMKFSAFLKFSIDISWLSLLTNSSAKQ